MVKNTLNVGQISEGFVLDHIQAGRSMDIYKYLHLDQLDCCVAIIKNAKSNCMGKKDIMKIECPIDFMDLDILGFIDHNITVNIIQNEKVVAKGGDALMSKIIVRIQLFLDTVFGHKYTGFTIQAPFINFSFAPTKLIQIALTDTDFFIGWFIT